MSSVSRILVVDEPRFGLYNPKRMKKYELMTIAKVNAGEDKAQELSNWVKDLISAGKGKVLNSSFMGKRKFAYKVEKDIEGFYEVFEFEMEPKNMVNFKNKLDLSESLTRYLVTVA